MAVHQLPTLALTAEEELGLILAVCRASRSVPLRLRRVLALPTPDLEALQMALVCLYDAAPVLQTGWPYAALG